MAGKRRYSQSLYAILIPIIGMPNSKVVALDKKINLYGNAANKYDIYSDWPSKLNLLAKNIYKYLITPTIIGYVATIMYMYFML